MLNESGQLRLVVVTHPPTSRSTIGLGTHLRESTPPGLQPPSEGARMQRPSVLPFPWRRSTAVLPTLHSHDWGSPDPTRRHHRAPLLERAADDIGQVLHEPSVALSGLSSRSYSA
jgi:hypothetical protein